MKPTIRILAIVVWGVLFALCSDVPGCAQDGKLKIHLTPKQAYVFVDGRAMSEASKRHSLKLSAGDHKVQLVNYGYVPAERAVTITAGQTTELEVALSPVSSTVSGPFGAMTIEGANHDAVLLNGKTPDFFVGHGDEFDHDWWWKQELVVPPGKYQVTVLRSGEERWSGTVDVPANQRVVISVPHGVRKTVSWSGGEISKPRFTVGTASATVAVAQPTGELSVSAGQINCGDSSQLKWTSADAPHVEITPVGQVAASGEQAVQPRQTTNYQLTAIGPGGTVTSAATVNVNTAVQANLALSPAEVQYKRIGDKVVQESSTTLNWTTANASTVSIDPVGTVGGSGNQSVHIASKATTPGPVDETVTYTLNATNECGGTATQTATLHIIGSIEALPELAMRSVYFQTDIPTLATAQDGLLPSEQETLKSIAEDFKRYLAITPDARLTLSGHADKRGPKKYNQGLSERRAQLVKTFLAEQGLSADALDTQGYGEEQNLSVQEVKQLLQENPNLSDEEREQKMGRLKTLVLANNRRVDIALSTTGQQSLRQYPYNAQDFAKLVDRNGPNTGSHVQLAAKKEKISN
jgi:outer membrane protein OmpA-like peptidoglycan-associated protein